MWQSKLKKFFLNSPFRSELPKKSRPKPMVPGGQSMY